MNRSTSMRRAAVALLIVAGYFLPAAMGGGLAIYGAFVPIVIFAIMAYGLDTVVSDLGEVSLGHTVFFAVGAYTAAMLSTRLHLSAPLTFVAANLVACGIAILLGLVTLRLRGFVFSLVTYAVAVVATTLAQNWAFLGGSDGISGIAGFAVHIGALSYSAKTDAEIWPVAYALLLVALWVVHAFRGSRLGRAAMMVHLNPRLATMSGIDPQSTRLRVLLFSAPITASAGWLYAYQRAYVSADVLDTYFLILMLTAVILVGRRMLLGPLVGVAIVIAQEKFFSFGTYVDKIALGSVLIAVLVLLPEGLRGSVDLAMERLRRSRIPADLNG